MAIDPRISLAVQQASIAPAIDIFNRVRQQQIENERQAMFDPLRAAQMQQGLEMGQQQLQRQQSLMQDEESIRDMNSIANFFDINQQDFQVGNEQFLKQKIIDSNLSDLNKREAIETIDSRGVEALSNQFGQVKNIVRGQQGQGLTASQRERQALIQDLQSDDPNVVQSAGVALGITPRAAISAQERIAESPEVTTAVAQSQAQIAGATEEATLEQQRQKLPDIRAAVKNAELTAKKQNEVFTDLNRAKAGLPGLEQVVGKLKELAPIATSTLSGKAFDFVAKELGFGGTKGATARAKFIATIDNQVLPLLRETFGAAFTAAEGDRLRDALADPDASPEAKIAQLEAFIEQKARNIQTSESELQGLQGSNAQTIGRFTVEVID